MQGNDWKYARFTNLIYQRIFHENAAECKKVLKLAAKANIRETLYSEVLNLIASFESGIAHELEVASTKKGDKLTQKRSREFVCHF